MQIQGSVAVITGASSGIGEATAWQLAGRGASVVLAARRVDRLEELAASIEERGGTAMVVPCDVVELDQIEALRDATLRTHGRCDILVNNAGLPGGGRLENLSAAQIERVVQVNVLGVIQTSRAFLEPMIEQRSGHILNMASLAGRHATPGASLYTATKHAVAAFSEALAGEVHAQGIRVTSINPGFASTEGFPQDELPKAIVMDPGQIARAVARAIVNDAGPQVSVPRWAGALELGRLGGPLYRMALRGLGSQRSKIQSPHTPPPDGSETSAS